MKRSVIFLLAILLLVEFTYAQVVEVGKQYNAFFYILVFSIIAIITLVIFFIIKKGYSFSHITNSFKPNTKKIIFSVIITIIWIAFLYWATSQIMCKICPAVKECNTNYSKLTPITVCFCGCFPLSKLLIHYLIILLPGAIGYLVYSTFEIFLKKQKP